jgi:hypothetical protein
LGAAQRIANLTLQNNPKLFLLRLQLANLRLSISVDVRAWIGAS